ncbi:DUF2336 domain-containing protein [Candidatus Liberibacter sp.]|uniref:DUF2336 domain-containing protein n=1 Tax=Candidatus Liberibacter sp. TaxID=34022 RepID=UPI0015F48302|nr:DUF2336 domain-containing protein [Candidatus Liberibacter sp.]MBA5724446.1 DUF2336 domain-containing protein [Candidatus Liberibacter sp.]
MSVQEFIKWTKIAKVQERINVARILGNTWCKGNFSEDDRGDLALAMTHLLDDSIPRVRLSLARSIALSDMAPRHVILALSEDHPDVSGTIILHSPILTDSDLIDIFNRGSDLTRVFIASRYRLSQVVSDELVKVGCIQDIIALLENKSALFSRFSLVQITERFCHLPNIRYLLSLRSDLPLKARYLLMKNVSSSLYQSEIVHNVISSGRAKVLIAESMRTGILEIISCTDDVQNLCEFVDILQCDGQLTPALLIHALIVGAIDFISIVLGNLSSHSKDKIYSILSTGGFHVVRALYESIGIDGAISEVFVEATMLWREISTYTIAIEPSIITDQLLQKMRKMEVSSSPLKELLEMVERIHLDANRKFVRLIAEESSRLIEAA